MSLVITFVNLIPRRKARAYAVLSFSERLLVYFESSMNDDSFEHLHASRVHVSEKMKNRNY